MDLNRIINMVTHQLIRRVVNMAVDGGLRFASRKTSQLTKPDPALPGVKDVTTPAELAQEAQLRTMADKAAKSASIGRRLGR